MYLRGECYGFVHYKGLEEVESCWGFYPNSDNNFTDIFMEVVPDLCTTNTLNCYSPCELEESYKYSTFDIDAFLRNRFPSIWKEEINKMNEERNGDYKIISSVATGTGDNIVLGEHMNDSKIAKYVTWLKINDNYYHGHYFSSLKDAQISMLNRAANEMGVDMEKYRQEQDFYKTLKTALESCFSDTKVESLLHNENFMQEVSNKYHSIQSSNKEFLINQIEDIVIAMNRESSKDDKEH